jgi:hypothetical protein
VRIGRRTTDPEIPTHGHVLVDESIGVGAVSLDAVDGRRQTKEDVGRALEQAPRGRGVGEIVVALAGREHLRAVTPQGVVSTDPRNPAPPVTTTEMLRRLAMPGPRVPTRLPAFFNVRSARASSMS